MEQSKAQSFFFILQKKNLHSSSKINVTQHWTILRQLSLSKGLEARTPEIYSQVYHRFLWSWASHLALSVLHFHQV